ncbi:MAG: hydantoinase/oxoprolinase family protein [Alphaproteobacteria bacterium]|nr:hydantoinase/oxoprolinase family protein [Alphaproteobacteria bacterium]
MTGIARIAVDVGGTFTDVVLEAGERRVTAKVLTTPAAPELGVIEAVTTALQSAGVKPGEVGLVIHGTTLATNALIERKGAKTALVTTEGFRDSIEIAYEHRFEQYDIYMQRPSPLVPRELRFGVAERVAADGAVLLALDEAAVRTVVPLLKAAAVEAVAIGFLHSYVNDSHERRARDILAARLPGVAITLSHEVCPEIREYDRFSTAVANAYVQPLMAGYLERLGKALTALGVSSPLLLMMSSGGMVTLETARAFPVRLVESGPAGGAILAKTLARSCRLDRVLSFDMGGTTAKICLIDDYEPRVSRSFEVARMYRFLKGSGLPLRIPVIDMVEIGAGGGSIATVDELKRIAVGPTSAGAAPGPACYGLGGTLPTVTDADLVLGRIDAGYFAGGKMTLDPGRAASALETVVGRALEMTDVIAAAGVSEIVDENMANAARVHSVECGKDLVGRTLIAFGGAAPLHAARLADKLGMDRVLVPAGAGVGSAIGFLQAPIGYEVVRSRYMDMRQFDPAPLNDLFGQMRAEALAVVRQGAPEAAVRESRQAFMRYRGQGHEVVVNLPLGELTGGDAATVEEAFQAAYRALYGRTIPNLPVEAMSWSLALATAGVELPEVAAVGRHAPLASGTRTLFDVDRGTTIEALVYRRNSLEPGATLAGPAVIVEDETATIVPGGFAAEVLSAGHILLTRKAAP